MKIFIRTILRGFSQVMLQNNALTGLLFLLGIFYNSWLLAIGALIAVLTGTFTAFVLKYKNKDILNGQYGFNAVLVGIALLFFFEVNVLLIALLILGSILSVLIMNYMTRKKIPAYTFPFVLSTWIVIIFIKILNLIPFQTQELIQTTNLNILSSLSMGFGQVMFQANIITGIIFLLAILVNSRITTLYALLGSLVGMLTAIILSFPLNLINLGIFGFNGVLCGIAFANKKVSSLIYAFISIILSVLIIYTFVTFNFIALTAPFVFATWITLGIRKIVK
ncbi:MAG: urea transporter [Nanoarchaeota archaeon]|nr:urea transporter [Nanoarchaeota archaeon]